jgi:hypothetical protein
VFFWQADIMAAPRPRDKPGSEDNRGKSKRGSLGTKADFLITRLFGFILGLNPFKKWPDGYRQNNHAKHCMLYLFFKQKTASRQKSPVNGRFFSKNGRFYGNLKFCPAY